MKKLLLTIAFAVTNLILYAQNQDMIEDWERAKAYTKAYLDAMPEDGYDFRPTPDIRSFAQQYLHTAAVNYRYINFATGQPNPYPGDDLEKVKEMQSKAAVTKVTMESYDAVILALKNLTKTQAQEKAVYYRWETTKEMIFRKGLEHLSHHRGQTTLYLRLKGVIPPGETLLNATERINTVETKP
ncbi:DinB family protein [Spirosoma areae]